jgi:hypothetical protein
VTEVDVRCPVTPRRLFAKLQLGEAEVDRSDNTLTVACLDCRTARRRMGQPCTLVLHRFNMLGACLGTEVRR